MVKHVVKGPCLREFARGEGAETFGFARGCGLSDFSRTWGVLHAPKPSAIPNFAKPGWIRFWRKGFGRCGESTGYYIRFAWKMQPPFFGRRGCFTDGVVVFQTAWLFYGRRGGFFGRQGCFFQRGEAFAPKSFPSRGRCRRRRRKRCRIGSQFLSTDAKTERMTPLPSSGLRETPDATLPSRGGIFARRAVPASCGPCCCPCAISSWRRRPRSRSRRGG